jgi:hypothetical protein
VCGANGQGEVPTRRPASLRRLWGLFAA